MREQCDDHKCKVLACGCSTAVLEDVSAFSEQIRAKDKWIEELLAEIESLKNE